MENRLKERLTGAAILVALIVLVVPEIFRGQPAQTGGSRAAPALQGPQAHSFTIDLNGAATQASPQAPPRAPPPQAPPQASPAPAPPQTAAPVSQGPPVPAPAVASPVSAPAAAKAPVGHKAAGRVSAAHAGAAGHAGVAGHAGAAGHAATSDAAGWSVQLGLFSKAENAARLAHTAHGKGFAVRVSRSSRGLYRVALVGLSDRAQALRASRRLHAAGLPAAVQGPR